MDLARIGALILCAAGVATLAGAAWSFLRIRAFLERATTTVGVVVALQEETEDEHEGGRVTSVTYFYPVVRFQTAAGAQVEFRSSVGSNRPGYRSGQQVAVVYEAARPEAARIRSFFQLWTLPLALASIGAIVSIVAAGFAFR